ncbi:MAG TPA: Pycsar system effector family protein, partial [Jiangellaceae bacterium]|nr:Pycsar system effector family protein [Jiangellaceae bacterium]
KDYSAPGEGIWWLGVAVAVGAILSAASAVWPRFSAVDVSQGIYYWGHVATFGTLLALTGAMDDAPAAEADRTRHQLHKLSLIVHRKYSLVRASMVLAGLAGVLFLIAGLTG